FSLQPYIARLFGIAAHVKVNPDDDSAEVLRGVEQSLLSHFSFDARSFSQAVTLKEVIAVIQAVPGVVTVRIDKFYRKDKPTLTSPDEHPSLSADPPHLQDDGTVSLAELLIIDPLHPVDALEVMP